MERRDLEDNEPLSRRRDRLHGIKPGMRASTMMNLSAPHLDVEEDDEDETLAQRVQRLKEQAAADNSLLPKSRPVSGDFKSELLSQFGGDKPDDKSKEVAGSPAPEEEETLGQRRKRLQAEREAQAKNGGVPADGGVPVVKQRRSMADILSAHPANHNRNPSQDKLKPATGLLGLHEKQKMQRASTMLNMNSQAYQHFPGPQNQPEQQLPQAQHQRSGGYKGGMYNDGRAGGAGAFPQQQFPFTNPTVGAGGFIPQFPQPSLNFGGFNNGMMQFSNPYTGVGLGAPQIGGFGMPGMNMQMNPLASMNMNMFQMNGMGMQPPPLSQGQIDMVERWRQGIM